MDRQVERRALAPGLSCSRVITGLRQIADLERGGVALDLEATAAAMAPYVDAGCTTFDMADHDGSAEDVAGIYRSQCTGTPPQLFTKWVPRPGKVTREEVRTSVQRALDRLHVTRLELLQFHAWRFADPQWLDCLFWLQELKQEGLIGNLGVTDFDTAHLRMALMSGIPIVTNQVSFSLLDQRARGRMSALCRAHGVHLLAYGTVAGGLLTERFLNKPPPAPGELSSGTLVKYGRLVQAAGGWEGLQRVLRATESVAQRHGVSMANVACRYILDQPAVAAVIVGARLGVSDHVAENARVFGFALDAADVRSIEVALAMLAAIPGDCGDEYRRPPFLTAPGDLSHHVDSFPPPYAVRKLGDRTICLTGTVWEPLAGYSRAARRGNRITISGTNAAHGTRLVGGTDPVAQTHFAIDKIEGALQSLGARLENVVRTRLYVRDVALWEAVARAHGERFGHIQPATTLVEVGLVGDEYLVEIEADADLEP